MKRLVIIPARGGSKRFPSKNVAKLHGQPMVFHSIEAGIGLFDKIIFTSDSDNILQVVKDEYGNFSAQNDCEIEITKRPDELATDTSKVIDTVSYYYDQNEGFDQIWLMLPTCPLRTREDVSGAQEMLLEGIDSVLSVTEYEFPPSLGLLTGAEGNLIAYDASDPWRTGNSRSQDHASVLRPNGALYGSWWKSFGEHRNYYRGKSRGYFMPRERSVDIDTKLDFQLAQTLLNKQ